MVFTHFIRCDFTIHQAPNLLTFYDHKKKIKSLDSHVSVSQIDQI